MRDRPTDNIIKRLCLAIARAEEHKRVNAIDVPYFRPSDNENVEISIEDAKVLVESHMFRLASKQE